MYDSFDRKDPDKAYRIFVSEWYASCEKSVALEMLFTKAEKIIIWLAENKLLENCFIKEEVHYPIYSNQNKFILYCGLSESEIVLYKLSL